ncbi:lytic transglycosylase domain-containing protein [Bartonella gliris]|uniref:lytic transglycosylase domain-containing protein n=1 Tax=Bartonella gliris TaxID=3004109 RepID=UPI003873B439
MTVPSFMMLAAACAPAIHPATLSTIVMQKSQGHIYAIGLHNDQKLSYQPSTFKEAVATAEQLKQSGHNFDIGLGQINVKNLESLGMSLSDLFDPCKNLKAVQTVLTHCYKRAVSKYSSEQTALQAALSCYNTENFKGGSTNTYVQKNASYVEVKVPALLDQESQESIQIHTGEAEKTIKTELLSTTSEEVPDAFTHKASGVRDAFKTGDSLHLEDNKNGG